LEIRGKWMSGNRDAFRAIVGCGLVKLNRYIANEKALSLEMMEYL
jgi:hypothetical protein